MQLSELYLDRYLYRDNDQSSETQDASFVSADSSDPVPSSIPVGGAAQDINISNVKIDGAQLEPGTYPVTVLDVANWGWGQTCLFSSTDSDTVSWGAGTFTSADGTSYSISAGNTGNMTAKTYIYLSLLDSETVYQHTTTPSDAVGLGKVLVAVAEDATAPDKATFMLSEASQIIGDNIVANSINASKIVTGSLIVGTNVALGTAFATADAGSLATLDLVETAQLGTTVIVGGYIKTSLLTADNIITGALQSSGYSYISTVFSASGTEIDLDNGTIRSKNFAIDSSGNAYLKGFLQAASGTIGGWNINSTSIYTGTEDHSGYTANAGDITIYSNGSSASIHANKFYIDTTGALVATSVTLTGSITATSGSISGSLVTSGIDADNITAGSLTGRTVSSTSGNNRIVLTNGDYLNFYASGSLKASLRGTTNGAGGLQLTSGDMYISNGRSYMIASDSVYGGISITTGDQFWLTLGTANTFYIKNSAQDVDYLTVSSTRTYINGYLFVGDYLRLDTYGSNPTTETGSIWHYSNTGTDQFRGEPSTGWIGSFDMTAI